jgi:hypothetical protein
VSGLKTDVEGKEGGEADDWEAGIPEDSRNRCGKEMDGRTGYPSTLSVVPEGIGIGKSRR